MQSRSVNVVASYACGSGLGGDGIIRIYNSSSRELIALIMYDLPVRP